MARNVNVWMANWHWMGNNVPIPQAQVDVKLEWADADGAEHEWEGTATFPNDLQLVPAVWLREILEDLILRVAQKRLGVD